jgi:hypothetical protein
MFKLSKQKDPLYVAIGLFCLFAGLLTCGR